MQLKNRYLPSLDGWRAIAIFAVLCAHDPDSHGFGFSEYDADPSGRLGGS
jgi:peptidoglycan/LPS O-acetylase OafA/YrhL